MGAPDAVCGNVVRGGESEEDELTTTILFHGRRFQISINAERVKNVFDRMLDEVTSPKVVSYCC
jgi:hypothetical protein